MPRKSNKFQIDYFYMVIVLPVWKSSLRQMIQQGHNNRQINLEILKTLKPIVCGQNYEHGDLKEK